MATTAQPPRAHPPALTPPPTNHTLQPHHLLLLKVLFTAFYSYKEKKLPPELMLHVHRVLLEEIAEVRQPLPYRDLVAKFEKGARSTISQILLAEMLNLPTWAQTPGHIITLFQGLPALFSDNGGKFARRSIFGYFTRRCYVTYLKLSFEGISSLFDDFQRWVSGNFSEESVYIKKDILTNVYNIFKTTVDKKEFARPDAYELWEKGLATGDDIVAADNLRRFFEQHFHESNDSGVRQHALLNLARMHYLRHEYVACRKLLEEAITVARTSNDRQTLQQCIGLLNRLPPLDPHRKMTINELQPESHPSEILHDVKKLLVVNYQQPLSAAFEKIVEASSLYDLWADQRRDQVTEAEQWGQHAVQSVVWSMLGNSQIAAIEEQVVIAFTPARSNDNTRLVVMLNHAYRHARQGKYQEAISMLLNPDVWIGLDIRDYQLWAAEIWHILVLRASRRGQTRMINDFLLPKRFANGFMPKEYMFGPSPPINSIIRDPLHEVMSMREVNQGHSVIQPLLTSLWHSEFQQRYALHRPALVLLADIGLEFGLTKSCRRIIEEIMPQLINGNDLEQRAFACFTLARCIIASADSTQTALQECVFYLNIAEADYEALEIYRSLQDTQFILSVVNHNLNMVLERDEAAERHHTTEKLAEEARVTGTEDWIVEILDVVSEVGVALTTR